MRKPPLFESGIGRKSGDFHFFNGSPLTAKGNAIETSLTKYIGLLVAGLLLSFAIWHFRQTSIRRFNLNNDSRLPERDRKFLRRQIVRRFASNACLAVAGLAMLCGVYATPKYGSPANQSVVLWTAAWSIVILAILCVVAIALLDYVAIKIHYSSDNEKRKIEKIRLDYELQKIQQNVKKPK